MAPLYVHRVPILPLHVHLNGMLLCIFCDILVHEINHFDRLHQGRSIWWIQYSIRSGLSLSNTSHFQPSIVLLIRYSPSWERRNKILLVWILSSPGDQDEKTRCNVTCENTFLHARVRKIFWSTDWTTDTPTPISPHCYNQSNTLPTTTKQTNRFSSSSSKLSDSPRPFPIFPSLHKPFGVLLNSGSSIPSPSTKSTFSPTYCVIDMYHWIHCLSVRQSPSITIPQSELPKFTQPPSFFPFW